MRSGRRRSSKQQANLFIMPIARSVAPSSNAPASEVTGPASNAAITFRPSTGSNSKKFGVQSVGIGALRESSINRCGTTIFADSQPRCTQFGERSALKTRREQPQNERATGEQDSEAGLAFDRTIGICPQCGYVSPELEAFRHNRVLAGAEQQID